MNHTKALASLEKKLSKDVGYRADLHIADTRRVSQTTAHFMLGYTGDDVSSSDISEFFVRYFDAKVIPHLSTARLYSDKKVLTVVASTLNLTREMEDIERRSMVPVVASLTYLDVPMKEVWKVVDKGGKKVLARVVKDDIMSIVAARKKAMLDQSSRQGMSFAALASEANILKYLNLLSVGDIVRCFDEDQVCEGEVLAVSDSEVKVKTKAGVQSLPRQAILEVIQRSPSMGAKDAAGQRDYYAKAYPGNYGDLFFGGSKK